MKASETYRRYVRDLHAFGEALHRLLEVMVQTEGMDFIGYPGTWVPRPGQEGEAARRRAEVDLLSGRAAYGIQAAGVYVQWKPPATMQTMRLNPVAEWSTIIMEAPRFDADTIFACVRQAIGVLDMKAEEAEDGEKHRVGRTSRAAVDASGVGPGSLGRWAIGAVGTLIVSVAAAGVVYWLGWI